MTPVLQTANHWRNDFGSVDPCRRFPNHESLPGRPIQSPRPGRTRPTRPARPAIVLSRFQGFIWKMEAAAHHAWLAGQNDVAAGADSIIDELCRTAFLLNSLDRTTGFTMQQQLSAWKAELGEQTERSAIYFGNALRRWQHRHNFGHQPEGYVQFELREGDGTIVLSPAQANQLDTMLSDMDLRGSIEVEATVERSARHPLGDLVVRIGQHRVVLPVDEVDPRARRWIANARSHPTTPSLSSFRSKHREGRLRTPSPPAIGTPAIGGRSATSFGKGLVAGLTSIRPGARLRTTLVSRSYIQGRRRVIELAQWLRDQIVDGLDNAEDLPEELRNALCERIETVDRRLESLACHYG